MRIRVLSLIAAMAALAGPGVASASEFRGGFSGIRTPTMGFHGRFGGHLRRAAVPRMGFHRPFFRPFHGIGNVPLYLDRGYDYPVVVVIQDRSESPYIASDLLSVSSVGGLPVVMGIREARPDRPEIQVPASEPVSAPTPESSSGVRIVHLKVPVGLR
jgi:hypothetical protein